MHSCTKYSTCYDTKSRRSFTLFFGLGFDFYYVGLTIRSAAEAGATSTCEPRRYSLLFHYEKIVYMSMKQKTVQ